MLFSGGDAVSIHTLAFAAFGLLDGLSKAAGGSDTLKRLEEDSKLRRGQEFWNDLKKLSNFLKHADRDPWASTTGIPEEFNEVTLLIDCFLLRELDELISAETQALWLWHHAIYFINIDDVPPAYWDWIDNYHPKLHSKTRAEKLEIGHELLEMIEKSDHGTFKMEPGQLLLPWRLVIRPSVS